MKRIPIVSVFAAVLLGCPLLVAAADGIPNMKGKWIGKTESIIAGQGGHWPSGTGTYDKPMLAEKEFVQEVVGQEGRRFWGVITLTGKGETTTEKFIGMLSGKDNRTIVLADSRGYYRGELTDDNTYSHCYTHTGQKPGFTVVACYEVKRAR